MIEMITKRVGNECQNQGTGFAFLTAQLSSAILTVIFGFIMDDMAKISTLYCFILSISLLCVSFIMGTLAEIFNRRKRFYGFTQSCLELRESLKIQIIRG